MIHGLSDEEQLKVIRPLLGDHLVDTYDMPVLHKIEESQLDIEKMEPIGIKSVNLKQDNSKKIAMPFCYDKELLRYWHDPLKYIPTFQSVMVIGTPDYSVYPEMNINEVRHNIYMSRWLGCLWQTYGCTVIPAVAWWNEDTHDICFSGLEKESIVMISTIGCMKNQDVFINGFNEMKKRIAPPLIIVYGKMINGMTGRFVNIDYTEAFSGKKSNSNEISLFTVSRVFERKEVV